MLETTLSTTFIPGTNLKGKVAGANWLFLLPSLNLSRVLVLGLPAATTLPVLSSFSQELLLVVNSAQQGQVAKRYAALHNVQLLPQTVGHALPLPDQSVDLILLADQTLVRTVGQDTAFGREIMRLLKPDGLLYYEYIGASDPLASTKVANGLEAMQRFWQTPLSGEMHTAVPGIDQPTVRYFREQGIYTPSLNRQSLRQIWRSVRKSRAKAGTSSAPVAEQKKNGKAVVKPVPTVLSVPRRQKRTLRMLVKQAKSSVRSLAKQLGASLLHNAGTAEEFLSRDQVLGARVQRRGILRSAAGAEGIDQLPAYLRTLAQADGVALDDFGWGLAARGDYSSRKLLFFLFDRERFGANQRTPADRPTYVIKMVRDGLFNARLENEVNALRMLYAYGVGDRETLPQVVFAGHHAGLAIVGESAIEGVPFRQRTQATADCPYAGAAVTWFTDLAAATADSAVATPAQVADTLQTLFSQFEAIYQLSPAHHHFLTDQIDRVRQSRTPFPLVFQHGDPGTWNMLVTPTGRVAILDWEAAEAQGMPLWDLFYFLRSYAVGVAQQQGVRNSLQAVTEQLLTPSPLRQRVNEAVQAYSTRIGLAQETVAPLFYTCWMHRSLKEATRLSPAQLETGHYVNLLRLCIDQASAVDDLCRVQA